MNGHILDGYPIAVDYFSPKAKSYVKFYFLTHMHSDHTVGLGSNWSEPVHCTSMTAKLLAHKFNISPKYIRILEDGITHSFNYENLSFSVTVLPANHCPGGCMFLFDFDDNRILYTGDFRFNSEIYKEIVTRCGKEKPIVDVLYLDNTYCHPCCSFPSKEDAVEHIVKLCLHFHDRRVKIGTSWTGHEELLVAVATALEEYVYVGPEMLARLELQHLPNVFSNDASSRIHAVSNHEITKSTVEFWNKTIPTVSIKPTAMYWGKNSSMSAIEEKDMHVVPYSNHCSYAEICGFVKLVAPRSIVPIVFGKRKIGMESYFRADMEQFSHFLSREPARKKSSVPNRPKIESTTHDDGSQYKIILNARSKKRKLHSKNHLNKKRKVQERRGIVFDDDKDKTTKENLNVLTTQTATNPTANAIKTAKKTRLGKAPKRSLRRVIEKEILQELDCILTKVSLDNLF